MNCTIAQARKLMKELKAKYDTDVSITMNFNSYSHDNGNVTVYVASLKNKSCTEKYYSYDDIRKEYGLNGSLELQSK